MASSWPDQRGAVDALVLAHLHGDVGRALDHVAVRGDQAVGADEESVPMPRTGVSPGPPLPGAVHALEELAERVAAAARGGGDDAHHGGHRRLHQGRDRRGRRGGAFLQQRRIGPERLGGGEEQREREHHARQRWGRPCPVRQRAVDFWTRRKRAARCGIRRTRRAPAVEEHAKFVGLVRVASASSSGPRRRRAAGETTFPLHCGSPSPRPARASKTVCCAGGLPGHRAAIAFFASLASKRPCSQERT